MVRVLKKLSLSLFILRETETAQVGEEQREGERERIPSRLHTANAEPDSGLKLRKPPDHDLSHPGAPRCAFLQDLLKASHRSLKQLDQLGKFSDLERFLL